MTIYELHINLEDGVDKLSTTSNPELTLQQRERLLDAAVERFIKQRYSGTNPKRTGFEETQKRSDDLATLVKPAILNVYSVGDYKTSTVSTAQYKLPDDYWFAVLERIFIQPMGCKYEKNVKVVARRHNEVNMLLEDPFQVPKDADVFRIEKGKVLEVFYDRTAKLGTYQLAYLAQFEKLQVNVNYQIEDPSKEDYWKVKEYWLNSQTHREIVNIAIGIYLETVTDPRAASTFPGVIGTME